MRCDNYKNLFTKDLLMGPNSLRLLDDMMSKAPDAIKTGRVLDLGCGCALTSLFIANGTNAKEIFATDLWISATNNQNRIKSWNMQDRIIPIHANALKLPYADEFFDTIVSVDSYHYFGCDDGVFAQKILPLLAPGGYALIAIPGVKENLSDNMPEIMTEWAQEEAAFFHPINWLNSHIRQGVEDKIEVSIYESELFDSIWEDWLTCGHEYAERD